MRKSSRAVVTSVVTAAAAVCALAAVPTWAAVSTSAPAMTSEVAQITYTMELTPGNQEQMFQASHTLPVFIVFGGPKCGGCKAFRALQEEMAPKQRDFISAYADTTTNAALAAKYTVRLAPEIIVVWKGEAYVRELGWPGEKTARKWINETIAAIKAGKPAPGTPMPGSPSAPAPAPSGPSTPVPAPTFTQPFPGSPNPGKPTIPPTFPGLPG